MDINEILNSLKKPALRFYLNDLKKKESVLESCFGGVPYIEKQEEVECCPNCEKKFNYVMQLNVPQKDKTQKNKLYSLFYCFDCARKGEVCNFSIVVHHLPEEGKAISYEKDSNNIDFPELPLHFYVAYELPEMDYLEEAFPEETAALDKIYKQDTYEIYNDLVVRFNNYTENTGCKMFGYPHDLVPSEIPNCPFTGEKMELFLAMPSEPEFGLDWGATKESNFIILKSPNHNYFKGYVNEYDFDEDEDEDDFEPEL